MIPCKNCITLPICRSKSLGYNAKLDYLDITIFSKCFCNKKYGHNYAVILTVARWYLRPSLYPTVPKGREYLIPESKKMYEKLMED